MLTDESITRLLTTDEVAERLRIHRGSVYRLIHSGELPACKLSHGRGALRIREDELEEWIRTRPRGGHDA